MVVLLEEARHSHNKAEPKQAEESREQEVRDRLEGLATFCIGHTFTATKQD